MRKKYDFSKATRGKCYRPDAELHLPVYLDEPVQSRLAELAHNKGVALSTLINSMLKKDIELIEMMQQVIPFRDGS